MKELRIKDFYQSYKQSVEELGKLREAHSVLISMIQNQHISIGASTFFTNEKKAKRKSLDNQRGKKSNSASRLLQT